MFKEPSAYNPDVPNRSNTPFRRSSINIVSPNASNIDKSLAPITTPSSPKSRRVSSAKTPDLKREIIQNQRETIVGSVSFTSDDDAPMTVDIDRMVSDLQLHGIGRNKESSIRYGDDISSDQKESDVVILEPDRSDNNSSNLNTIYRLQGRVINYQHDETDLLADEDDDEDDEDDEEEEEMDMEENYLDDGDSDIEANAFDALISPNGGSDKMKSLSGTHSSLLPTSSSSESVDVKSANDTQEVGVGAFGMEGGLLSQIFRSNESMVSIETDELRGAQNLQDKFLSMINRSSHESTPTSKKEHFEGGIIVGDSTPLESENNTNIRKSTSSTLFPKLLNFGGKKLGKLRSRKVVNATYGPGFTKIHPWTTRDDQGINSRVHSRRGNEIYYVGIIDILQQYNIVKRTENFIKVTEFFFIIDT
jgi:hypothetical protein